MYLDKIDIHMEGESLMDLIVAVSDYLAEHGGDAYTSDLPVELRLGFLTSSAKDKKLTHWTAPTAGSHDVFKAMIAEGGEEEKRAHLIKKALVSTEGKLALLEAIVARANKKAGTEVAFAKKSV